MFGRLFGVVTSVPTSISRLTHLESINNSKKISMENAQMQGVASLFTPVQVGAFKLEHRVVLPPLTRMRTTTEFIPNALMVEYYSQRATSGGLMITEGTVINETG